MHCSITELDKFDFSFNVTIAEDVYDVSALGVSHLCFLCLCSSGTTYSIAVCIHIDSAATH